MTGIEINSMGGPNDNFYKKIIVFCFFLIVGLATFNYYQNQKPAKQIVFDEKPLKDSMAIIQDMYVAKQDEIDSIIKRNNERHLSSTQIIIRYNDKFKFLKGKSASELDSVLKLSW